MNEQYREIIEKAVDAKNNAYAPYSNFFVGAALLADNGTVYTGCNVENASYGLTICAERTAICKAVSEGERSFKALAIAADTDSHTAPCGACRQFIWEVCGDIDIVLINNQGKEKTIGMKALLPMAFSAKNLDENT